MRHAPVLLRRIVAPALAAALLAPALALAGDPAGPAAIAMPGDESARASFERFAQSWMGKFRQAEDENRENPTVRAAAAGMVATYRGYGDDYTIELRPTGRPAAPYIGLLRYTELTYSCVGQECSVASQAPVTEIFRFQDGRWVY